jgi:hypothetical protein
MSEDDVIGLRKEVGEIKNQDENKSLLYWTTFFHRNHSLQHQLLLQNALTP